MTQPVVLLVEDNDLVRETIGAGLAEEGYVVITAACAKECTNSLVAARPDIILLDIMLPDGNGLNLIKYIREHTNVPVIIISGKNEMVDKIVGLEMGADDYVGKPVQLKELAARVKAQLRRYNSMKMEKSPDAPAAKRSDAARIRFGSWILDRPRFQVFTESGRDVGLTPREFRLLEALVLEPDRALSREQLLGKVQSENHDVTDRVIDVQILRIRRKIGDRAESAEVIRAVRGIGYMFVAETEVLASG